MRCFPRARRASRKLPALASSDGRTAAAWVDVPASEHSKHERCRVLACWLLANKFWTGPAPNRKGSILPSFKTPEVLENADKAIGRIRRGLMDPIESANKMIDLVTERHLSTASIINFRCQILLFLRFSRLGLDPEDLRISVKHVSRRKVTTVAKLPTRDQIRSLLLAAPLKTKLLISMLISTGARVGELTRVKVSDVDFARTPVHVYFRETKTGPTRIGFLSPETVELLQHYLKVRKYRDYEYIFDGNVSATRARRRRSGDVPMARTTGWHRISRVLRQVGMNQKADKIHFYYHPHTFRVLSLALMKSQGGLPSDWAEHLVGHFIGTAGAYLPTTDDLAKEWLKIQDRFCFLSENPKPARDAPPPSEIIQDADIPRPTKQSHVRARLHEPTPAADNTTHRWASTTWLFVKADMHSSDFDQALADGYAIYDSDGASLRLLRKRKTPFVAERCRSLIPGDHLS